eukprot:comp5857_c0_seq1/m.1719 comp5857_c0_seq1/g.1719  ORF comp5857_c0_seq1/g.1719 comp5857_c0_seq1/m.1719 type:complete len:294 (-) comp5857_c0_seq1:387-1268(-)
MAPTSNKPKGPQGPSKKVIWTTLGLAIALSVALIAAAIGVWVGLEVEQKPPPPLEQMLMDLSKNLGLVEKVPDIAEAMLTPAFAAQLAASFAKNMPLETLDKTLHATVKFAARFVYEVLKQMPQENAKAVGSSLGKVIMESINNSTKKEISTVIEDLIPPINATLQGLNEGLLYNQTDHLAPLQKTADGITMFLQNVMTKPNFVSDYAYLTTQVLDPGMRFVMPIIATVTEANIFEKVMEPVDKGIHLTPAILRPDWGVARSKSYWTYAWMTSKKFTDWWYDTLMNDVNTWKE